MKTNFQVYSVYVLKCIKCMFYDKTTFSEFLKIFPNKLIVYCASFVYDKKRECVN